MSTVIDKRTSEHPSYGVLAMERIGGYSPNLVGTVSGQHQTAIRLTLARGQRGQSFKEDHWSPAGRPLVVVEMSLLQWAELLTLTGQGVQTPCTLVQVAGETQPEPPKHDSAMERVLQESRADLFDGPDPSDAAREELRALREEIGALKITKSARSALNARIDGALSKLRDPGIVAHVAVERLGRHLQTAAAEARIEARASNSPPGLALDLAMARMLPEAAG